MKNRETDTVRILAVDDEKEVLESYRHILAAEQDDMFTDINARVKKLFGGSNSREQQLPFKLVTCRQGDRAIELVEQSLQEGKPFSVAFIDVRMPPGPDGAWAARQIHALDPRMNIVIVTAYSDVPPQEISRDFRIPSRLFYIQKPFHSNEILQFAMALSENWKIHKELTIQNDLFEELAANQVAALNMSEQESQDAREKLRKSTEKIEEMNVALRVLLNEMELFRKDTEESIEMHISTNVRPHLTKLKNTDLTAEQEQIVAALEQNLKNITPSFSSLKASRGLKLTPVELQVANMIKLGSTTKEIAQELNLSPQTIESYRKNIRKKMGLTNKKQNLRTSLLELL